MFGLKGRDTFNKPTSDINMIIKKAKKWWIKLFPYVLLTIIFCIIIVIGYTWHKYLYTKDVTETEKTEYVDKKMKEVTFEKEKFDTLREKIFKRQEQFNKQRGEYNNVFYKQKKLENDKNDETEQ